MHKVCWAVWATAIAWVGCAPETNPGRDDNLSSPIGPITAGTGAGIGAIPTGFAGTGYAGTGHVPLNPIPTTSAGTGALPPRGNAGTSAPAATAGTGAAGRPARPPATPAPMAGSVTEPKIPPMPATCPQIRTGNIQVQGHSVTLWVGTKGEKPGPIVFYWHGTGSSASEATGGLGNGNSEVMAMGGVIASFSDSTAEGQTTGNNVWYVGDFKLADDILACAIAQQNVDPKRVYTAGCSAGGLQSGAMVYARSSYLAASMPNSGGITFRFPLDEPGHIPALITAHGAMGSDVVVVDFSETSAAITQDVAAKGGFAVDCDHGGGHCLSPASIKNAQWQFLKDHPFGITPEPYANGLPSGFPSQCKIIAK
jgi:hypothetical protein